MIKPLLLVIGLVTSLCAHSQTAIEKGSGNALSLNGIDNWVDLAFGDNYTSAFSYSINFKLDAYPDAGKLGALLNKVSYFASSTADFPFFSYVSNTGKFVVGFSYGDDFTYDVVLTSTTNLELNKWYKITVTYRAGGMASLYVNGVLEQTSAIATISVNFATWAIGRASVEIGGGVNTTWFKGEIDELSMWSTELTQQQVRDWLCRKLTNAHPAYANLVSYHRFDYPTGTISMPDRVAPRNAFVYSDNLVAPVFMTSGAAIGDASSSNYGATPSATLAHASGESVTATVTSGGATGIHIYRVDEKPNSTTGIMGVGNNDRYFGVFVTGGTSPQYSLTYNYSGNLTIGPAEPTLRLYRRNDNSVTNWTDCNAVLNTTLNTLTTTGEHTEYMLGSTGAALPIHLLSLRADRSASGNTVLRWSTTRESDDKSFTIQRSLTGDQFTDLATVNALTTATPVKDYSFTDPQALQGTVYYRLKMTSISGRTELSKIVWLSAKEKSSVGLFPNPAGSFLFLSGIDPAQKLSIQVWNTKGQLVMAEDGKDVRESIDVSKLGKGTYVLKVFGKELLYTGRFVRL